MERHLASAAELRAEPHDEADVLDQVPAGAPFELLDESRGWAWGYAGEERRVGYLPSDALA